ncbi:hypothetical protein GEMRC1_007571 [Eukaryota sp. GEM-RC1]
MFFLRKPKQQLTPSESIKFILATSTKAAVSGFLSGFAYELFHSTVKGAITPKAAIPLRDRTFNAIIAGRQMSLTSSLFAGMESSLMCLTKHEGSALSAASAGISALVINKGPVKTKLMNASSFMIMTLSTDLLCGKPFYQKLDFSSIHDEYC